MRAVVARPAVRAVVATTPVIAKGKNFMAFLVVVPNLNRCSWCAYRLLGGKVTPTLLLPP